MRIPKTQVVIVIVALCGALCFAGYVGQAASPVRRLIDMEELLYGAPQEGPVVGRLESVERAIFGDIGPGTLPERLERCWNFVQGDRAGSMNLKFKLKAAEWIMFGRITDGAVVPILEHLETSLIGQQQNGSIGSRLDCLLQLTVPSGRPDVGYALLPKGSLVKAKMLTPISSMKSRPGDLVNFEVVDDVIFEGRLILPAGSSFNARIIDTVRPTKIGVRARVDMELDPVQGMDSSLVTLGVDQIAIGANPNVTLVAGDALRNFSVMGKEGALGGVLSQNPELELDAGVECFFSVMQTTKILGFAVPGAEQ